jgi:nitrite reductase/ring-hydroxylating ferredoxin subunit
MSGHGYVAVGWNPYKKRYDATLLAGIVLYLAVFSLLNLAIHPNATVETTLIRALGTLAFLLLHVVLSIGPLCRLDSRWLPLLSNRRHLGVATFVIGLGHAALALFQFHALGALSPLESLFLSNPRYDSLSEFPFEILGFFALLILFLMAATSHDFWLATLTPMAWKSLHMLVYAAYALLVLHVALGALQSERSPVLTAIVAIGFLWIAGLHVTAALRERTLDRPPAEEWIRVARLEEIPDNRARIVAGTKERIAVYRFGDRVSALSNVCAHQGGPLGEGKILEGCVTCPWHGYQYLPETGIAPPPFTERVEKYETRVEDGVVWVRS